MTRGWQTLALGLVACGTPPPPSSEPDPTPHVVTVPPAAERDRAAASEPAAASKPAAEQSPALASDPSDPATLARAVYEALVAGDAAAYVKLTVSQPQDYEALSRIMSHPPPAPDPAKLAARRQIAATQFERFLLELQLRGIDPSKAALVEIRTDKAARKGDMGFAEDLTVVLEQGGSRIEVTIDDCVLTGRGWLIADDLKLRQ